MLRDKTGLPGTIIENCYCGRESQLDSLKNGARLLVFAFVFIGAAITLAGPDEQKSDKAVLGSALQNEQSRQSSDRADETKVERNRDNLRASR